MPLSVREKKRRSRASKPSAYHDREREASRKRMAMNRARNKAQKRASQLRSLLNEADQKEIEARADEEKQRLIRDWFNRERLGFDPRLVENDKILSAMPKRELCAIELQLAKFEISLFRVGRDGGDEMKVYLDVGSGKDNEKNVAKSDKIDSSEHNLNNQIDCFPEKEMASSVICGNEVPEILDKEQEDTTKPAHSGKNGSGALSKGKEDCISWEDEVLAAEAMATMQHMRRAGRQIHPRAENKCESSAVATEGFGIRK